MASSRSRVLVFGLLLAVGVPAQVPPGWIVVATTTKGQVQAPWGNLAGLWLAHPRTPGAMIEVTGLPASLTTPPVSWPYEYGCGGVAIHGPSGDLLVGDVTDTGSPLNLYRIRITPAATTPLTYAATLIATHSLGIGGTPYGGTVSHIAFRDANRIIVTACDVQSGPLGPGPMQVGEMNLATGIVTPWPAVSASFTGAYEGRAVCIDDTGYYAYFAGAPGLTATSTIRKVTLPATGVPTVVNVLATGLPFQAFTMRWDRANQKLIVSGRQNPTNGGSLWEVDPVTGVATAIGPLGPTNMATFDIEPTTGDTLFAGVPSNGVPGLHHYVRSTPNGTWLGNSAASGGIGLPFGCAVAPSPTPFGIASVASAAATVTWAATSNAGLPLVGNAGYSLQLDVGPTGALAIGFLFASVGRIAPTPIPGLGLVLNLAPPLISGPTFTTSTIPLPIPNLAALAGQDLFLQAVTVTSFPGPGVVLGATEGAWLRIL